MSKLNGEICTKCGLRAESYKGASRHLPCGYLLAQRYYIGRVLGEGGFGMTYLGIDVILGKKVAIKEYFPSVWVKRFSEKSLNVYCNTGCEENFKKGRERFVREARAMSRMNSQKEIADAVDFFEKNNTAYLVMEYVDGITLKERVQKQGPMPVDELFELMYAIMDALQAMHGEGLIHRDISPDNIMIENGKLRLIDFGCAREDISGDKSMTVMHKQGFSPAEQYQRRGQGPWSDVYSLAATMYYCITGRVPPQAVDRLMGDKLIKPSDMGIKISAKQEQALLKAMAVRKEERYQSVSSFKSALKGAPQNSAIPAQTPAQAAGTAFTGAVQCSPEQTHASAMQTQQGRTSDNVPFSQEGAPAAQNADTGKAAFPAAGEGRSFEYDKGEAQSFEYDKKEKGAASVFAGGNTSSARTAEGSPGDAQAPETAQESSVGTEKRKLPKSIYLVAAAAAAIVLILIIILVVRFFILRNSDTQDVSVNVSADETETVEWSYEDGTLTISGSGPMDDYEEEGAPWYSHAQEIESVVIEDGVTSIGDCSFYNCSALSSVSIPSGVSSIGCYAFTYCESLVQVQLPESVTEIGEGAFYACIALEEINLPQELTALNMGVFAWCISLEYIEIPESVTGIGSYCFAYCYLLEEMFLSENVKVIGEEVFAYTGIEYFEVDSASEYFVCEGGVLFSSDMETLIAYPAENTDTEEYDIPDSVRTIKAGAFEGNNWLEVINVPAGVEEIGDNAFTGGLWLEEINVDSSNSAYSSQDGVLFNKAKTELIAYPMCRPLTSWEIPETVEIIGDYAFFYNENLEGIIIPESVTEIGDYAFYGVYSLETLYYAGSEDEWNAISVGDYNSLSDYETVYDYEAQ